MMSAAAKDSAIFRRVFRNTASNYADIIITLAARFFLTPLILHELGATIFGLWVLVASLMDYGRLFDFGISGALTKFVAEDQVTDNVDRSRRLISASLFLYTLLGVSLIAIISGTAPLLTELIHVPAAEHREATRFLILMGVWVGLSLPCSTTSAVLRGLQRFDAINLIDIIIGTILPAVAIVVVLLMGGGLVSLVLVNIVTVLVVQIPSIFLINRFAPELRFGWHGIDRQSIRTVLTFGSWIFIGQTATRLNTKTDTIVIGAVLSLGAVTPYSLALRLTEVGRVLVTQFLQVLLPVASELHAERDWKRLKALYITSTRLVLAISIPIGGAFVALAGQFLALWVGPAYESYSYLVTILMLAVVISLSQWPAASVFQGMNRYGLLALIALTSGLVNLGLSIILGMRYGLIGVALGTLIPTAIENFGFILPYSMHVLEVSVSDVIRRIVLPTFLPAVPAAIFLYLSVQALSPRSLIEITVIAATSTMLYVAGYLGFGASRGERQAYRSVALQTMRFAEARLRRP
jgi:O-antigen/teichoic acid export membrane protein